MKLNRACGILLHPTSLPGPFGIGELGKEALDFVDFLAVARQQIWQVLPLNPVGYGESPYQSFSAFAGNPLLISLSELWKEGLLVTEELSAAPFFPGDQVDYQALLPWKQGLLEKAYRRFKERIFPDDYDTFIAANFHWLHDYGLFMALKEHFAGLPWNRWDRDVALRRPEAVARYENLLEDRVDFQYFLQYCFFTHWNRIKTYAKEKGITVVGDMPLFISYDSSDAWVYPHLFELDEEGNPAKVAGVPPDYFSATGQLWGNPHYRWQVMAEDDYFWWRQRFALLLDQVDVVRVDHFRGLEAYWEIPAGEETAVNGRWVQGPGEDFFLTLEKYLGELPLLAEDLGFITPQVHELKDRFGYPGMKVLQFISAESLEGRQKEENVVFYTGTHDNDTLVGWYRQTVLAGLEGSCIPDTERICREFMEIVYQSPANWAIIPLQDALALGSWARMNIPGTVGENWRWRCRREHLSDRVAQLLAGLSVASGRS